MTPESERIDDRLRIEAEISSWAKGARPQYGNSRRAYNHVICDKLATAGIPPLAAIVLRIGAWGQTNSVSEDVSSWYANLASTLATREAQIPLPAIQHANALIEQIWKAARNQVDQSHIEPLRQELDAATLTNQSLQEDHNEFIKKLDEAVSQNAVSNQKIADLQVQNQSLINRFEESQTSLHRLQTNAQQAEIEHQQKLSLLVDTHAKERQAFQAEHFATMEDARKTMESVETRASNERNALLLRMDRINQDLIQSRQQITKLQASHEQLKEVSAQTKIEFATKVAAEDQFRNKSVALEYRLNELQTINTTLSDANTTLQGKLLVLLENMQELNAVQQHQQSGKAVRFTKAIERAIDVFEDSKSAISWLQSPNESLGGSSPLSLIDTDSGAVSVMQALGRIQDGVFP